MATDITLTDFENEVLKSDVPVLVDFWAEWCGPCKMLTPIINNIAKTTDGKAKVFKVNVDYQPVLAQKYGVTTIPTVIIFKNGEVVDTVVGINQQQTYIDLLGL